MLKAFVARNCFRKLYAALPDELDIFLAQSVDAPTSISLRPFEDALRSFEFKTIELGQAVSIYEIYFPEQKAELHSYFGFLASTRNSSVHAAIPDFQRFDLARVSYLAIKLMKHLTALEIVSEPAELTANTTAILQRFDLERVERVTKLIKAARAKAKTLRGKRQAIFIDPADFDSLVVPCPICETDVITSGYTRESGTSEEDAALTYAITAFECEHCGLEISDARDFRLVGMMENYDRSDHWDDWSRQYADAF